MRARRAILVRRARNAEEIYASAAHVVVGPVVAEQRRTCACFLRSLLGTSLYAVRRSLRCFVRGVFGIRLNVAFVKVPGAKALVYAVGTPVSGLHGPGIAPTLLHSTPVYGISDSDLT